MGSATSEDTLSDQGTTSTGLVPDLVLPSAGCDVFAQDCPAGEKCLAVASTSGFMDPLDTTECVVIQSGSPPGDPCMNWFDMPNMSWFDTCDATSMCWNGTCEPFCMGTLAQPICPPGLHCSISYEGLLALCVIASECDPLLQDCEPGSGCYFDGLRFMCALQSLDLPTQSPCDFINDCAPGHMCVHASMLPNCAGSNCCARFCDLGLDPAQCEVPGTSCDPVFVIPELGLEPVGVCRMPGP